MAILTTVNVMDGPVTMVKPPGPKKRLLPMPRSNELIFLKLLGAVVQLRYCQGLTWFNS